MDICLVLLLLPICLFRAEAVQEKLIRVSARKTTNGTEFIVANLQAAPVTVTFEVDLQNFAASRPLPLTLTLEPALSQTAFTLHAVDTNKDSSWSYTYYATWGAMDVTPDLSYVYALPYMPGKSYPVSQGYHGKFSHFGSDEYAIDWKMPVGTPVYAARDGIVVGAKDDSDIGGAEKKFEWDANYILVQHSDKTLGHYVHLQKDGNLVKVGDHVQVGELIGHSGNTGHSTGPHLHFAVFRAHDGKLRETLPVKYKTAEGTGLTLVEGHSYRATDISASRPALAAQ